MIYQFFVCAFFLSLLACNLPQDSKEIDKKAITEEVKQMLDSYHDDIKRNGLTAEFNYLDQSGDFYWVPPGYRSALTYDSVKSILEMNAKHFSHVELRFDTLQIFPLTENIVNYSGIVRGMMTDTSGSKTNVAIIESGTIIKRKDGWKLLSGQSANLTTE